MKSSCYLSIITALLALLVLSGCEVTREKINIWKLGDKGAPKLRACIRDGSQTMEIRIECAGAVAEMGLGFYLAQDLKSLKPEESKKIIGKLTALLISKMNGSNLKETTRVKIQAKDALYSIRGFLEKGERTKVDQAVVTWILADFRKRNEGDHSVEKVVKTVGQAAAKPLADSLDTGGTPPLYVSVLLRRVGDQASRDAAAVKLVARSKKDKKLNPRILEALGRVGSIVAVDYLNGMATKGDMTQKVLCLRALQLFPHVKSLPLAQSIAADDTLKDDKALIREEAFNLLSVISDPKALDILAGFMTHKVEDVRYTAMHQIIEGFRDKGLTKLLQSLAASYTYKKQDLADLVVSYIVDLGPKALPPIRSGLKSSNWLAKLVCIQVLARLGTKQDMVALEKIATDKVKIKGWEGATIGSEAMAAVKQIQSRKK